MMAGVDMVHIAYRRSALALNDLMGGQVQVMFEAMPSAIGQIKAGRVRAPAVNTSTRSPIFPNVPAVAEFLPGFEPYSWYGVGAPRRTPAAVVSLLNDEVNAALADGQFKARLAALDGSVLGAPALTSAGWWPPKQKNGATSSMPPKSSSTKREVGQKAPLKLRKSAPSASPPKPVETVFSNGFPGIDIPPFLAIAKTDQNVRGVA
ncbi:MAG: extra-cytoplasmic solute receptor family protein [Herminiimonas sp.]|nr:extra-cytoplasmic solute receptor family protein [Herminiimonas sp.]